MPGTFGGAGDFTLAAKALVKKDKNLQVWALDRREQALEDTSMFEKGTEGRSHPAGGLRLLPRTASRRRYKFVDTDRR